MSDLLEGPITVEAREEVWKAVLSALKRSTSSDPFYHALVLEIESALEDRQNAWFERYAEDV